MMTSTRWRVLASDPPWGFEVSGLKGCIDARDGTCKYATMTAEELAAVEVPAAEDCVMFMWATLSNWPLA